MSVDFPITVWGLARWIYTGHDNYLRQLGIMDPNSSAQTPFDDLEPIERRVFLLLADSILTYYMPDRIVLDPSDKGGYQLEYEVREMAEKARGKR